MMQACRGLLCVIVLLAASCGERRHDSPKADLAKRAETVSQRQAGLKSSLLAALAANLDADRSSGREPRLDILLLSGGGSWGAFGAGFLHGWSRMPSDHPLAMPRFDLVSGVSTGALIAPYALIGTPAYLERIERVYRSCQEDWAPLRSMFDLISAPSLCDTTLLDRTLREQMDAGLARELVAIQEREHRQAITVSSDVDLGRPVIWRLGDQARLGLSSAAGYDPDPLFKALRSSAAIPGAFSPVEVDGSLHVDGAVYGQIHVLSDMRIVDQLVADWRLKAGAQPLPKIRYWVILNNRLRVEHKTIQPNWSDSALRSVELMLNAQVAAPLNRLALFVDGMRMKHGLDVELRWVQIPADWAMPPDVSEFHPSVTNGLSDLGLRMGSDPASWRGPDQLGLGVEDAAPEASP